MLTKKWKIGDKVLRPVFSPETLTRRGWKQIWDRGVVEAIRPHDDRVLVRSYNHVYEHPGYELRER